MLDIASVLSLVPDLFASDIKSLNFLYMATPGGRGWQIKLADMDAAVQKEDSQNLPVQNMAQR